MISNEEVEKLALRKAEEAVLYAVGDYASNLKDDRFGSRRRLLEAYSEYKKLHDRQFGGEK